ncbi:MULTISPECIES: glycoside hydrolase family 26 protein [unclassified Streptomyces]|uniref:glycoside hydrolase family 26 protein n=1 Tax=unclassified Streptomyces TaxID=2593676 RepID=UPI0018E455AE|nr:glycosyl hydrolase [Streptomyces sp. DH-12]
MAPQHRRVRARALAVGAAAVVVTAALAAGPAAGAAPTDDTGAASPGPTGRPAPAAGAQPAPAAGPAAPAFPTPDVGVPAVSVPYLPAPAVPAVPEVRPPAVAPPSTPAPAEGVPPFGAFLASDERGVERMEQLSRWLGGAELRVGHTYLPGNHWKDIEGDVGFLEAWARWRNADDTRMLVLNVPLQERNEAGVPDGEVRELLRRGAAGEFDHHFRALAERLVALRIPDTVLVLGWEMNGITYTHRCGPDPENWKKYWNRIVTTMRSVPGQEFRFEFTPNRGRDAVPWTQCYPGDDTVDIIGMDSYDQPSGMSFDEQVEEPYGLQAHVDFAKAHGKPISYPEWGLFRNGDNPAYMRGMLAWMQRHRPLYHTVTDYCPHGVWQCDDNPESSRVFRSALYGRTPEDPQTPAPAEPPAGPELPDHCAPLDLGRWVEHWLGGKLCLRLDWWSRSR